VRRNLAVAGALAKASPSSSILVATSADEAESLGIRPGIDVLKLPGLRKVDNEHYAARRLPVSWEEIRAVRAKLLATAVESFRPAVLLVDKHPIGVGGELRPALEAARLAGARTAFGLRDILDDPAEVRADWRAHAVYEQIAEYFDRVLVYGQQDVADPVRDYGFPDELASITSFCGYVLSPGAPDDRESAADLLPAGTESEPLVLATAGGGQDGFPLLSTFVEAAAGAHWQGVVVAGPQCGSNELRSLHRLSARAGVAFRRFVPGLAKAFGSLDALVCMGGYNTLAEAVSSRVPTVCVPRVQPRTEQLIRARAFARRGLLNVLDPRRLDAAALREEVDSALGERPRGPGASLDFDGAERAAGLLLGLAAEAPARLERLTGAGQRS
jgi:predicted glycosyltransferase